MDKVYIVTSGAYSDFRNEAVYTDKAKAEKHHSFLEESGEHTTIQEWEVNQIPNKIDRGLKYYRVDMDNEGNTSHVARAIPDGEYFFTPSDRRGGYIMYDWARSKEHAIKIANEKRIQHKAKN